MDVRDRREFIFDVVGKRPDFTMPEFAAVLHEAKAVAIHPSNQSRFLIACGPSYKTMPFGNGTSQA